MKTRTVKSIELRKYGPFWGVYVNKDLLAVTLYKKGGESVKELLENLTGIVPPPEPVRAKGERRTAKV